MPSDAPPAAQPSKSIFDPFNSSATGHQRADNRLSGSTAWRHSRTRKLREQFASGHSGGKRVNDSVGAGSLAFGLDGRTANGGWEPGASGLRERGQKSLWDTVKPDDDGGDENPSRPNKRVKLGDGVAAKPSRVVNPFGPFRKENGRIRESSWTSHEAQPLTFRDAPCGGFDSQDGNQSLRLEETDQNGDESAQGTLPPQIFANLTFYINGSTAPLSDHGIKRSLSRHGGRVAMCLGRRTVTHVVVGKPCSDGGVGGGLAASKLQREIARVGGKGVKFVSADWIAESVQAGKRLPESRFDALKLAPKGVASAASLFKPQRKTLDGANDENQLDEIVLRSADTDVR